MPEKLAITQGWSRQQSPAGRQSLDTTIGPSFYSGAPRSFASQAIRNTTRRETVEVDRFDGFLHNPSRIDGMSSKKGRLRTKHTMARQTTMHADFDGQDDWLIRSMSIATRMTSHRRAAEPQRGQAANGTLQRTWRIVQGFRPNSRLTGLHRRRPSSGYNRTLPKSIPQSPAFRADDSRLREPQY
jgi:hypothetical protein